MLLPNNRDLEFRVAELERKLANIVRPGRIYEVSAERTRVRVAYDADAAGNAVVTTWLPWLTARAGVVLTWSAPSLGEQVLLLAPVGDLAQAYVLPAIYQVPQDPPTDVQEHALLLPAGDKLRIEGDIEVTGGITVDGGVSATSVSAPNAQGASVSLGTHRHAGLGTPPIP